MRRMMLVAATMAMLGGGTVAAIEGCGGSDASTTGGSDAGKTSTSSSSTSSTSSTSSSSSGGDTTPDDGGVEAGPTMPASNPGQISCGPASCDGGTAGATQSVCCLRPGDGAGSACATQSFQGGCSNTGADAGLSLACDEAADCTQGKNNADVCCYVKLDFGGGGNANNASFSTQCVPSTACRTFGNGPAVERPVLCKTDAECANAGIDGGGAPVPCNPKTCDGFQLYVCGSPAGCQ